MFTSIRSATPYLSLLATQDANQALSDEVDKKMQGADFLSSTDKDADGVNTLEDQSLKSTQPIDDAEKKLIKKEVGTGKLPPIVGGGEKSAVSVNNTTKSTRPKALKQATLNFASPGRSYSAPPALAGAENKAIKSNTKKVTTKRSDLKQEKLSFAPANSFDSTFSKINDVASLIKILNQWLDLNDAVVVQINSEEMDALWNLAARMASDFLNHQFLNASTITEITALRCFMQDKLQKKVSNKLQQMLEQELSEIDKCSTLNADLKNPELTAFAFLNNLRLMVKYAGAISLKKNNLIKIFNTLHDFMKIMSSYRDEFRTKLNVLGSRVLIEIATQMRSEGINSKVFYQTLFGLFNYFKSLKSSQNFYLDYRADYACQALIDIYLQVRDNSSKNNKTDQESSADEGIEALEKWLGRLGIEDSVNVEKRQPKTLNEDKKLISSQETENGFFDHFSVNVATQKIDSWYKELKKIDQIIADRGIQEAEVDAKKITQTLSPAEKKAFLWGFYERIVSLALNGGKFGSTRQIALKILSKDFWNEEIWGETLKTKLDVFRNIIIPADEYFFSGVISYEIYPRKILNKWLDKFTLEKDLQGKFSIELRGLLLESIFDFPPISNYLINRSKKLTISKNVSQKISIDGNLHQLDIKSSKFRFFRRMQWIDQSECNIASIKCVKGEGEDRRVIYLITYSLGSGRADGTKKFFLPGETESNKDKTLKKRGHSEAVLVAVQRIGYVAIDGGKILNLAGFKREYCASTNEPCSKGKTGEGCKEELLTSLTPMFYANKYKGNGDARGFKQATNDHLRGHKSGDKSDDESETEYEAVVIKSRYFEDKNFNNVDEQKPAPAEYFRAYLNGRMHENKRAPTRLDKSFYAASSRKIFADYANPGKRAGVISFIKENERIVSLGIEEARSASSETTDMENLPETLLNLTLV